MAVASAAPAKNVAEFANIRWPIVRREAGDRRGRQRAGADVRRELLKKFAGDGPNVAASIAKRRDAHDEAF